MDETPELSGVEIIHIATAHVIERFAADRGGPLERVLAQVDDRRHVGRRLFSRPAEWLLVELELEVIDPDGPQLRLAEIKDFVARRRSLAG